MTTATATATPTDERETHLDHATMDRDVLAFLEWVAVLNVQWRKQVAATLAPATPPTKRPKHTKSA